VSLHHIHVDLREFPLKPGDESERSYNLQVAPLLLGGQRYEVLLDEEGVVLGVERVAGGFLVTVTLTATLYGPCVRCLREVRTRASASEQEFAPARRADYEENDISPFIQDMVVDVAGLAREALLLGLPTQILCADDCPGLCPSCGQDLHLGSCSCQAMPADSRWERLKDLRVES
jgi:uncharacterized protein